LSNSLATIAPWLVVMCAYTPGPCFAAVGLDVSLPVASGFAADGFSGEGAGVAAGDAGVSAGAAGVSGVGVGAGVGVAAGGSEGRAGSGGAPHPAAAIVSTHTKPTIHLVIAISLSAFTDHRLP
jgi:hypothetical protein